MILSVRTNCVNKNIAKVDLIACTPHSSGPKPSTSRPSITSTVVWRKISFECTIVICSLTNIMLAGELTEAFYWWWWPMSLLGIAPCCSHALSPIRLFDRSSVIQMRCWLLLLRIIRLHVEFYWFLCVVFRIGGFWYEGVWFFFPLRCWGIRRTSLKKRGFLLLVLPSLYSLWWNECSINVWTRWVGGIFDVWSQGLGSYII